jgi:hypothetical protein
MSQVVFRARPWWWFPRSSWWSTIRFPLQRATRIYHPRGIDPHDPRHAGTLVHEMVHVERQWSRWWGPWIVPILYLLLPLPVLMSGRWWIERPAYLADIRAGRMTIDRAIEVLQTQYWRPWPRAWMRRWFERQLQEART